MPCQLGSVRCVRGAMPAPPRQVLGTRICTRSGFDDRQPAITKSPDPNRGRHAHRSALAGTNGCVSPDHPLRPRTDPGDSSLADKAACRPNRLLSLAGVDVAMGCTGETTSGSQAYEESARPCVIAKEHIVMSRRLISPDASATISGDVAAGTLVDGRVRLAGGELVYTRAGEGPVVLLIHGL